MILDKSYKESHQADYFNDDEILLLNKRIDDMPEDFKELKTGQEIIWTDIMNEMNELKNMYNLPKKNWWQMFLGKIGDMILSGIIDETISKKIVEIFISPIKGLLHG